MLAVVSLPFSNFGMSIAGFWLSGTWLLDQWHTDGQTRRYRWSKALGNPVFWVLTGLFLVHVVGMAHTSDWQYGLRDLRIKLPLLLFPLIFFTARPIDGKVFRRMLLVFVLAAGVAALICLMIPLGLLNREVSNVRNISIFISHVRFSMLLVFACAVLLLWLSERRCIWLAVPLLVVNLSFLWVIESLTGAFLLCAVLLLFLVSDEASVLQRGVRRTLRIALPLAIIVAGAWMYNAMLNHLRIPESFLESLPEHSAHGSPYEHHMGNSQKENNHLIWYCIARNELDTAWQRRSALPLYGEDGRGHQVFTTLLRYMTSMGLTKDAVGVQALSDEDIRRVEAGVTSVLEFKHKGLRRRFDKLLFEVSLVKNGGNPSGSSVTQRLEFWRAAVYLIAQNPVLGVGTGDVKGSMTEAYEAIDSKLYDPFRLRAHNQYLTFWVAFGIAGVLLLLASLFIPLGVPVPERGFLFTAFCLIVALSYLTEDTLETQAGVTFVSFFAALFAVQRLSFHARIRPGSSGQG